MNQDFLKTLKERGFIYQMTDEAQLAELIQNNKIPSAYIGFDCTATSLHVGSLLQIMVLRHMQQCGIQPIILLGGATTRIGDPTGKDETRKALSEEQIATNMAGIQKVFARFLSFEGKNKAITVNNSDWWDGLGYIEVLRDIGKYFSVNQMLGKESVRQRLERDAPFSFIEFNYMLFQAYDFAHLKNTHACRLQIGGSDQWGNIVSGVELYRKMHGQEEGRAAQTDWQKQQGLFGLTTPLITTASGGKMGKTAQGAIWLDPELLSPYDYWQFWRNTHDDDVEKFLLFFTELDAEEIKRELPKAKNSSAINEWKKRLATEATAMLHGKEAAEKAAETATKIFVEGSVGDAIPQIEITRAELEAGIPAHKILTLAKLAESGGDARRLIRGKGAKLNDEVMADENALIGIAQLDSEGKIKLSAGKKKHAVLVVK